MSKTTGATARPTAPPGTSQGLLPLVSTILPATRAMEGPALLWTSVKPERERVLDWTIYTSWHMSQAQLPAGSRSPWEKVPPEMLMKGHLDEKPDDLPVRRRRLQT